jgi:acyl-homoserine lactone acylase PvdQ
MARLLPVALAVLALAAPASAATPDHLDPAYLARIDDAVIHGTITPPGADTRHALAELAAYDGLVQAYPTLTAAKLGDFFKLRTFGQDDAARTYTPRSGVTVMRDARWGEPKILGETDEDLAFGAGYVAAEDRLAIMELLRALGRAEAFEMLGTVPAWFADLEMARMYGYTEDEWQAQLDRLPERYGPAGRDVKRMVEEYAEGVNQYLIEAARGEVPLPPALADTAGLPAPWTARDVVAAVSTVRAMFGAGGGSELTNAAVLSGLTADFGPETGKAIYEDFRNRDNADAPVHTTRRFPYHLPRRSKLDPAATPGNPTAGDPGIATQLEALAGRAAIRYDRLKLDTALGSIDLSSPGSMSNHLVVGASRSASGNPILIGGPQAGYFSPQILMDYELHSPTIHARGAGFPGLSTLVVMGRTQDYAWSPTAGGSDMIDTYVEKLCNPSGGPVSESSRHYEFRGECVPMDRRTYRDADAAPAALRDRLPDIVVERTVHGPVYARGKLGDMPVAVSRRRSSYMKELDSAVSILKMNRNEAETARKFVKIFRESHNLSTNWSYISRDEIGYVHGGLYPRRPAAAHPDFPVWGTGQWEWGEDYLGVGEVPNQVNPRRDFFVSWNNKPAPRWGASDQQWGHSGIYRASLLEDAIRAERRRKRKITPTRLTQMMEQAGLTDLRGRYVAPLVLRVLEHAELGAREQEMVALLRRWIDEGALRRDGDGDGSYDHGAAVAIMDALWEPLIRAMYDPVLGDAGRIPLGFDNAPGAGGSAYMDGWYGYLWTDLKMVLGDRVKSPTSRVYCGGSREASGSLGACAQRVADALRAAGDALGGEPSEWNADAEGERIRFLPAAVLSMHWVNRPTTQQLAMFGARKKR